MSFDIDLVAYLSPEERLGLLATLRALPGSSPWAVQVHDPPKRDPSLSKAQNVLRFATHREASVLDQDGDGTVAQVVIASDADHIAAHHPHATLHLYQELAKERMGREATEDVPVKHAFPWPVDEAYDRILGLLETT